MRKPLVTMAMLRRSTTLEHAPASALINLEVGDVEAFNMAQNPQRLASYQGAVRDWAHVTYAIIRQTISSRSSTIPEELKYKIYNEKTYRYAQKISFSFPRHGIYLHYGARKGYRGSMGSKWEVLRRTTAGVTVGTGIFRHTNMVGGRYMGTGNSPAFEWFDPIIRKRLPLLDKIIANYWDTMTLDASRIFINK